MDGFTMTWPARLQYLTSFMHEAICAVRPENSELTPALRLLLINSVERRLEGLSPRQAENELLEDLIALQQLIEGASPQSEPELYSALWAIFSVLLREEFGFSRLLAPQFDYKLA